MYIKIYFTSILLLTFFLSIHVAHADIEEDTAIIHKENGYNSGNIKTSQDKFDSSLKNNELDLLKSQLKEAILSGNPIYKLYVETKELNFSDRFSIQEYLSFCRQLALAYAEKKDFKNALEIIGIIDFVIFNSPKYKTKEKNFWVKRLTATPEEIEKINTVNSGPPQLEYLESKIAYLREAKKKGLSEKIKSVIDELEKLETYPRELPVPNKNYENTYKSNLKTSWAYLAEAEVYAGNIEKSFELAKKVEEEKIDYSYFFIEFYNHKSVWHILASALIETGNLSRAEEAIEKIDSETDKILLRIKTAEQLIALNQFNEAALNLKKIEESIRTDLPPDVLIQILQLLSKSYYQIQDPIGSTRTLNQAKALMLKNMDIMNPKTAHDVEPQFKPLQDILNNLVLQQRYKEIPPMFELRQNQVWRYNEYILKAANYAATLNQVEVADFLINDVRKRLDITGEITKKNMEANKENYKNIENWEEYVQQNTEYPKRTAYETILRYFLDISINLAKHNHTTEAKILLVESEMAMAKLAHLMSHNRNEYMSDYTKFVTKRAIVNTISNKKENLAAEDLQGILLLIKARNAYFTLKDLSQLLDESGLINDSKKVLALFYDVHLRPYGSRYNNLQNEYMNAAVYLSERGEFGKAQEIMDAMLAGGNHPFSYEGALATVVLFKQRLLAELALAAIENNMPTEAGEIHDKLDHPFYKHLVSEALGRQQEKPLSFDDVIKDVWSDEELVLTIPFLTHLAKLQFFANKQTEAQKVISYIEKIEASFPIGYRCAETHIILSDYYKNINDIVNARWHLEEAQKYIERGREFAEHTTILKEVLAQKLKSLTKN